MVHFLIDEANRAATTSRTLPGGGGLQTLWPDYPPVRQALDAYRREVLGYVPVYEGLMVSLQPPAPSWGRRGGHQLGVQRLVLA